MCQFLPWGRQAVPVVCFLLAGLTGGRAVSADNARPNILYLYVDDMGWGSIGPNGQAKRRSDGQPFVRTPNLDRLAREGVNFTRGYGCHVCSPARSSQQTGFHQGHTFADRNDPNNAKKAMRADDVLIGDALSAVGYATGYWGKWGYGGSKDLANPVIENVQTLPTAHGYQHVLAELHHIRAHTFFQPTLWSAPADSASVGGLQLIPNSMAAFQSNDGYPDGPANQNHPDYPDTAYCDDVYAMSALDFVRRQGNQYNQTRQPFFGLLAVQIPHAPFAEVATLPQWDQAYRDDPKFAGLADQTRQWAAMVTRIDAHFGNLLAALEDPNNDGDDSDSIADNTLVIFQSDNGGPGGKNLVELDANGGLRGTKGSIYEGGIRVPLVMRWPAMIHADSKLKAGTDSHRVVDVTDLMPTFCQLAGAPIPLGVDGVSLAPTLLGTDQQRRREFIIHEAGNGQSIIRGNQKLVRSRNTSYALYDLEADPTESHDLAAEFPERVAELKQLLLDERVAEPRGFANSYHHWTGADNAATSAADNWSDYRYANAGVTYMIDQGAPQLSWVAHVTNDSDKPNTARVDADVQFLALEIRGSGPAATQTMALDSGVGLVGRNEIRIAPHGQLSLRQGTVSTQRWIQIAPLGTFRGAGVIDGSVFNDGTVIGQAASGQEASGQEASAAVGSGPADLQIRGDYHQSADGSLHCVVGTGGKASLAVSGAAVLGGKLIVQFAAGAAPTAGQRIRVLTAARLTGRFDNPGDQVVTADGQRLRIDYDATSVTITLTD
ncbi:sulfatase-like hydrolase/transferase [Stieleria sp. TO1_6]|uniref:sulfatase-like hydrolase/transferase n=1 Tax=Stieleria tagensis TaxID=2956795 RepID=UPI00209B8C89|nr:sulfatase-like hydrolase/transferase [Stieleria tagensis]MCO8121695.1 sulfatase-like hydrolase/transferase [Stieleria tagensis]